MEKNLNVITGGSGWLGYALTRELAARGERIRLFLHNDDSSLFEGIDCEKVIGDISDEKKLNEAFKCAKTVFHVAGVVDISGKKDKLVWTVNFEGTKNVVKACKKAGVKTLVYVSSVDAIPAGGGKEAVREICRFDPKLLEGAYAKSKAAATEYVLEANDENLKTCAVLPSACIGPYDFHGTSNIGTMMRLYSKGYFPFTFDFGGYNFVDVRDVAKGMASAAEYAKGGECYILGGKTVDLGEFVGMLALINGKRRPKIVLKKKTVANFIPLFNRAAEMLKIPPVLNDYSLRKLCENCNFSSEKAERELGYTTRPLMDSLKDMDGDWKAGAKEKHKVKAKHKKKYIPLKRQA